MSTLLLGALGHHVSGAKNNDTTSGYTHTYYQYENMDTGALCGCKWPSDNVIDELAVSSVLEAAQLAQACGVCIKMETTPSSYDDPINASDDIGKADCDCLVNEGMPVNILKPLALLQIL